MYLGSDAMALAPLTRRIAYMEEGDWVEINHERAIVRDAEGQIVEREIRETAASGALVGKGNFRHFMEKEIHEQPAVIGDTLHSYFNPQERAVHLPELPFDLAEIPRITVTACGTAFYAGHVARYWLEQLARIPVDIDVASEMRYREAPMREGGATILVSQSGETADTMAALKYAQGEGQHLISVVNVPESSIARASDVVLPTHAGPEIGVASTKAFTTQLTVLACLAIAAGRARGDHRPRPRGRTHPGDHRGAGAGGRSAEPRRTYSRAWPIRSPKRGTCFISAGARPIRSRWKAR